MPETLSIDLSYRVERESGLGSIQRLNLRAEADSASSLLALSSRATLGSRLLLEYRASNGHNPELEALAAEWKRTRKGTSSSITKLVLHPAYQRIIGKGRDAIPFLLGEIQREPDHWFWALTYITGEDPVADEDRGDIDAMTRAWLAWGCQRGYL